MRRRYTDEDRKKLIAEVRSTSKTVKAVAEGMGVGVPTAYVWVRSARATKADAPMFARLVPTARTQRSTIVVRVGSASIEVDADFDAELLRAVVATLSGVAP